MTDPTHRILLVGKTGITNVARSIDDFQYGLAVTDERIG